MRKIQKWTALINGLTAIIWAFSLIVDFRHGRSLLFDGALFIVSASLSIGAFICR